MIPWLDRDDPFPLVDSALKRPNGLLAAGGDLSPERLLDAYSHGIFPWFSDDDPILWWSPDPRMVLFPSELHVSRSLRRTIRSGRYTVTADRAFADVMAGCAGLRKDQDGTWITAEMVTAYSRLADLGFAHSIEVWAGDELAGGLYGVALGRMFYGESMFSRLSDASKVALVALVRQLERWGFALIDCQMTTPHLASMGAQTISRREFLERLSVAVTEPPIDAPWVLDVGP
jgi:leucyl/phenylalanyl-tRNA--protein transferase